MRIELDCIGVEETMNDYEILFLHEEEENIEEENGDDALGAEDMNLINWDIGVTYFTEKIGSEVECEEIAGMRSYSGHHEDIEENNY